jgi:hypothetical protein
LKEIEEEHTTVEENSPVCLCFNWFKSETARIN